MCEKFIETYRNLQRALVPETAKVIAELIRGDKKLIRIKELSKETNHAFKTASFITNCSHLKPVFCKHIMHVSKSQLIPIEIDAQVPPGKGVAIQCFSGMENVEDGSYEITHLVTLQIFNLKLDALTNEEHFEQYVLLPYLLAVGSSPFGMSNFRLRGVHILILQRLTWNTR